MKIHIGSYITWYCIQLLFITACSVTKVNKSEWKVFRPGEIWADEDSNQNEFGKYDLSKWFKKKVLIKYFIL